jgi:NodT family efflux transporter outer membrane factor (OMF) lipoprotein
VVQSRQETASRVRLRYEQGLRPPGDLRLAENVAATAEAALAVRLRVLDAAARQFEILLGRYPSGAAMDAAVLPSMPPPVPAGLPADLIARRPDLLASEMILVAAGARVAESRAALLPQIRLTASGGTSSGELLDLLRGDFVVWSLVAGLTQPLFNGGRLRAGVDAAEAAREAAVAAYAQSALVAFAEVETALAADQFLRVQEEALARAITDATAARRLAEDRYFAGLAAYLDVLEAQRLEIAAESQWLEVRRLRLATRVDLHLALGGQFG